MPRPSARGRIVDRLKRTIPPTYLLRRGTQICRIYFKEPFDYQWDTFRTWGPTDSRWDHHLEPKRDHPDRGIMYVAEDQISSTHRGGLVCLAETFQGGIVHPTHNRPHLVTFRLEQDLQVLDIGQGVWLTSVGADQGLTSGDKRKSRRWAQAIYDAYPDLMGIRYNARLGNGMCYAFFERAHFALPTSPVKDISLNERLLFNHFIVPWAKECRYIVNLI